MVEFLKLMLKVDPESRGSEEGKQNHSMAPAQRIIETRVRSLSSIFKDSVGKIPSSAKLYCRCMY